MQVIKRGTPIEVKIIAYFVLGLGVIETALITPLILTHSAAWAPFYQIIDRIGWYFGGIMNGIPAGDGRIGQFDWILAEGVITIAIGFFLLRGYKAGWMAIIALSVFRLVMLHPFNMWFPIVLNALIIVFMSRPRVLRFFFRTL